MSEERQLRLLCLDAPLCLVEVFFRQLEADEVPLLLDARDGGGARAHTVVQHRVALVGVGQDKVAQQIDGLLGGVESVTFYNSELDALLWIANAWIVVSCAWTAAELSVSRFACFSESMDAA